MSPTTILQLQVAFKQALETGCKIAGIRAGDTLGDLAEAMAWNTRILNTKEDSIEFANGLIDKHFDMWRNLPRIPHERLEAAKAEARESFAYCLERGATS